MIKPNTGHLPHLLKHLPFRTRRGTLVVSAVVIGGIVAIWSAWAAGFYLSVEPESGTLSGGAKVVTDSAASGGKAVQLGATPTPTPTPAPTPSPTPGGVTFNHCTNPTYTLPTNPSNPQDGYTLSGYYVTNDTWNFSKYPSSQQTMYICGYNNWYAMVNVNDNANNGEVKTYPNVHKDYSSPKISTFTNITSTFAHTAPGSGDWDYAYDIWLNGLNYELMVWTQSSGRQAHVPGIPTVATVTLGGITYNIHRNGTYIAYDMPAATTSGNLNLLQIINDAVSRGYIPGTATLSQIDYGVEVCNTGSVSTKFEVNNFGITSQ